MFGNLILIGFVGLLAGLILLIVRGAQKKSSEPVLYVLEASFVLMLIGVAFG